MPDDPQHRRRSIRLPGYDYAQPGGYFVTMCTHGRQPLFGALHGDTMQCSAAGHMVEHWWQALNGKFPTVRTDALVVMPDHVHGIVVITEKNNDVYAGGYTNPPLHNDCNDSNAVGADASIRPQCNGGDGHAGDDHVAGDDFIVGRHIGRPLHGDGDDGDDANDANDANAVDHAVGANRRVRPQCNGDDANDANTVDHAVGANRRVHPIASNVAVSLPHVIQWFKTMTTNAYIRNVQTGLFPPFDRRVWQRGYWEHIIRDDDALQAIRRYVAENPRRHAARLDALLARMQRKDSL
ncbi:MAG: hypothetical protein MUD01_07945 [Chloroflexaceae bacterium]|jgi:REP element-mobilizing transposase RayT|nr:hypothetical protein [Chloroflexaceae bacterium]